MKLRTRLIFLSLGIIMIVSGIIMSYMFINTYNNTKKHVVENIEKTTYEIAKEMESILDDAIHDAEGIVDTLEIMKKSGITDRALVNQMLKEKLEENPNYIYSWIVWEENAFDGMDFQYGNTPGSDSSGRYLPCWGRSGDKLVLEICSEYEKNDYYNVPKVTKKNFIAEPATYKLDGKEVTTVSFCVPIVIENKFLGVAGLDISLEQLTKINSTVKLYENGFGRLLSKNGIILAHLDHEKVNKVGGEFSNDEGKEYLAKIQNGDKFNNTSFSPYLNQDVYRFYSPINFEGVDNIWSFSTVVPISEMMAETNSMIRWMIIMGIIGISIMGITLYYNSNYAVRSVVVLTEIVERFSTYDLSFDENHEAVKYLERKDETGRMTKALATMQMNFTDLIKKVLDASGQVAASSEELTATSQQSATASEEVARTIEELARGATDQARDTETGSEKVYQLGEIIESNQGLMVDVSNASDKVGKLIDEGLLVINDLIEKTKESGNSAREIYDVIIKTNESSDKIGQASNVIASIAEQTNLLALNAAIEAARAGEAGKGFAVVAEEIRKLAEQSTMSTKEIDSIVNELTNNANSAVEKMEKASETVEKQMQSVNETESKYKEIADAIEDAESAIEKMSGSVEDMESKKTDILDIIQSLSAIAQENAAGTEEASASTEEQSASMQEIANASEGLSEVAQELQKSISQFKL
ncbi:methyl-accepting chemotaxis protein [Wukongibacter baidiensis]|uniref:methyl-accepting chemotaxis protein n=1 Tax=Wukongibacter baidiensis TaxID=1723361 RepID=UPI003D7FC09A